MDKVEFKFYEETDQLDLVDNLALEIWSEVLPRDSRTDETLNRITSIIRQTILLPSKSRPSISREVMQQKLNSSLITAFHAGAAANAYDTVIAQKNDWVNWEGTNAISNKLLDDLGIK